MILQVASLVRELFPERFAGEPISVACVRATTEKYLVFGRDAASPAAVVQFGHRAELERLHHVLRCLHARVPHLVPDSLACMPIEPERWIHVQTGAPGRPWFQLARACRTPRDWSRLLERSAAALTELHRATSEIPGWVEVVKPADALDDVLRQVRLLGVTVPADLPARASAAASRLDGWSLTAPWQHGDFSLNNLLVSDTGVTIIDFEEFGWTAMPLHDQFGLALWVPLAHPQGGARLAEEAWRVVVESHPFVRSVDPGRLDALLLHHVLWRIVEATRRPGRSVLRERLLEMLQTDTGVWPLAGTTASAVSHA
jgi:hypothetical protein